MSNSVSGFAKVAGGSAAQGWPRVTGEEASGIVEQGCAAQVWRLGFADPGQRRAPHRVWERERELRLANYFVFSTGINVILRVKFL